MRRRGRRKEGGPAVGKPAFCRRGKGRKEKKKNVRPNAK